MDTERHCTVFMFQYLVVFGLKTSSSTNFSTHLVHLVVRKRLNYIFERSKKEESVTLRQNVQIFTNSKIVFAPRGNRTLASCLEGRYSATEL